MNADLLWARHTAHPGHCPESVAPMRSKVQVVDLFFLLLPSASNSTSKVFTVINEVPSSVSMFLTLSLPTCFLEIPKCPKILHGRRSFSSVQ